MDSSVPAGPEAAGAERAQGLAQAVRHAADDLEASSPEIARHVRAAADSVEGVAAVKVAGGLEDEVQVRLDERKLAQLNLSAANVIERLAQEIVVAQKQEIDVMHLVLEEGR